MQRHNMKTPQAGHLIQVRDSKHILQKAMAYFLSFENKKMQWLPEYEEVADWLSGNKGRGIFLYGNCGRGKSLMVRYILPAIILQQCHKVVNVYDIQEMNSQLDTLLTKSLIALDDIGSEEVVNSYGNRRLAFAEIMDAAEKQHKLILISSNLDEQGLRNRYGDRTLDRIKATTRRILFRGESLRQ